MFPIHTILHPTDFSAHSEAAFGLACSLARDHGARLVILHVLQPPVTLVGGMAALPPMPDEYGREAAWEKLRSLQPGEGVGNFEHVLREGDIVTEILRVAEETSCDLIAMGTHGRTGLSRLLMGSVAESVLRKARCPVLHVKNPPATTSRQERETETALTV